MVFVTLKLSRYSIVSLRSCEGHHVFTEYASAHLCICSFCATIVTMNKKSCLVLNWCVQPKYVWLTGFLLSDVYLIVELCSVLCVYVCLSVCISMCVCAPTCVYICVCVYGRVSG